MSSVVFTAFTDQLAAIAERIENLSKPQTRCFMAILEFIDEHGYSPSIRELTTMQGLKSKSTTKALVDQLQELGLISFEPGLSRTIRIRDADE